MLGPQADCPNWLSPLVPHASLLPTLYLIGIAHAGTSELFLQVAAHPAVVSPAVPAGAPGLQRHTLEELSLSMAVQLLAALRRQQGSLRHIVAYQSSPTLLYLQRCVLL